MLKRIVYALVAAVVLLPFTPLKVLAAYNTVTVADTTVSVLMESGKSYTVGTNLAVESFTVNGTTSQIEFSMPAGSAAQIVSSDRSPMTFTGVSNCVSTIVCSATQNQADVTCNTGSTETVTLIIGAGTCTVPGSGPGAGGTSSYTPPPAPAQVPVVPTTPTTPTTPAMPTTPTPTTPIATPTPTPAPSPTFVTPAVTSAPSAATVTIETSAPDSAVQFSNIVSNSYQPGELLKYVYQYKNMEEKTTKVRIYRQLVNSKGKVVRQSTGVFTLKAGATFVKSISEAVNKKLPAGEYTIKVKTLDAKTKKVIDENSFNIEIEKLKKKIFSLGEVIEPDSDITFDEKILAKIRSNVALPVNMQFKYSYINNTETKQSIKMVRELVNENGKVMASAKGNWTMKPGEKYGLSVRQYLGSNLPAGDYNIRIRAYDKKTNEILVENAFGVAIELK